MQTQGLHLVHPPDAAAALTSPLLTVVPGAPPAGQAEQLRARMPRFSDGDDHHRGRAAVERLLPEVAGLEASARLLGARHAPCAAGTWDAMPLARAVPVAVLGSALGLPETVLPRVVALVGQLCDALAPGRGPTSSGDAAAVELQGLLGQWWEAEEVVAVVSLLFQTRDATAGLIGSALLHGLDVERTLREQAPVQCTARRAVGSGAVGEVTVEAGQTVWVVLAGDEHAAFGAGPHACPGAGHARALARGVLAALTEAGWVAVAGQPVVLEPRPNLRIPQQVLLERR